MRQVEKGRRFPPLAIAAVPMCAVPIRAILVCAVLICAPLMLVAQSPAGETDRAPAPAPHAAAAPAPHAAAAPAPHATPEQIGDAFLAHHRYQEAIAAYKKDPRPSATVWNKMGIAYELMFDAGDAERCYKKSLKLNRRDAHVINNLGTIYDSQKKYRKAERMYRKAIKLDPKSATMLKNLGTNQLARRKYEKGLEAYRKALALDPHIFDQPPASAVQNTASLQERGAMNYYMAKSCVQAGLAERAIQFLRLALSEGFTSPKKVAEDASFAKLRHYPAFQQLIAEHTSQ